jgi:hypothetical protein
MCTIRVHAFPTPHESTVHICWQCVLIISTDGFIDVHLQFRNTSRAYLVNIIPSLRNPHSKKSARERCGEWGGKGMGPNWEMSLSPDCWHRNCIAFLAMWHMVPSYWNHMSSNTVFFCQTSWPGGDTPDFCLRARSPAVLTGLYDFSWSLWGSARILPHLGHNCFLPNSFQFFIHQLTYHLQLHSINTESVKKRKKNCVLSLKLKKDKKFWEELIAYFPLIWHGPHRKRSHCLAMIRGLLPSRCLATIGGYTDTHSQTHTRTVTWSHKPILIFQNRKVG